MNRFSKPAHVVRRCLRTSVPMALPPDLLARVDALAPLFWTKAKDATRSTILRALIAAGLETMDQESSSGRYAHLTRQRR